MFNEASASLKNGNGSDGRRNSPPYKPRIIVSTQRNIPSSRTPSAESLQRASSSRSLATLTSSSSSSSPQADFNWKERLSYYLPCFSWLPTYTTDKLLGDAVAGLSLASFQIPLALSYATSVAHVPALCGLYSLAIPPIFYAVFGSVPQMIVGPESAISLVVGQGVEHFRSKQKDIDPVDLVSVMSCIGGFYLLGAGLCRFGFLDNVLSRALLRGFITGVGIVMIVNSLYDELGLSASTVVIAHHISPFRKLAYLLSNLKNLHFTTSMISLVSFVSLFTVQLIKKRAISKGYKKFVFLPEILILVVTTIVFSGIYDWKSSGVVVVGEIKTKDFSYKSPFGKKLLPLYNELMPAGFLAATLGFFESATASKSLGSIYDLSISSNRELVALGSINIFGGIIGALPAFGGYGRSRINALSGAQTTISGLIMGCITLMTISFLLGFIYCLPICVLSVITTMVGFKLLDETPADVMFHIRSRGYSELLTFCITVLATIFYSIEAGITLGVGYSVIRVIKNSTKSRIQILGRVPNTNKFLNADEPLPEAYGEFLEEVEGCLIVKIAEPLTFSNTSDLKLRLLRLERYGSSKTHPAAARTRQESMNRYILFDLNGMTYLDSSAAQIFLEILTSYRNRDIDLYLIRVPTKREIRERLKNSGILETTKDQKFYHSIDEALQVIDEREAEQHARKNSETLV